MKMFEPAQRLKLIPPYLFKDIDEKKEQVRARGVDIIDLGVGDPDLPTPWFIVEKMQQAVADPRTHRYPLYSGLSTFKEAVARWYRRRFDVELDPDTEVLTLIGCKEGIAHLPLGVNDPEDINLMTTPAYPVYHMGTLFAGANCFMLPLTAENNFLPDFHEIPPLEARDAKLFFFNYPNNPTGATATLEDFQKIMDFCREYRITPVHDACYTEMAFDGFSPPSFLQLPGAKEMGIEFHSLSKTYSMTGWRLGMAVGNREVLAALGKIKSNIDSGAFDAIQLAGIAALDSDQSCVREYNAIYQERRDLLVTGLQKLGYQVTPPKATFYVWMPTPPGFTSMSFAAHLLEHAGIVGVPGVGFGDPGEGYLRLALTVVKERLEEALARLAKVG
ncbi:MAG: aminotransferase class I/II-fold pyridoxal phosphate-dependent enzyme [Deltaproteobacteria bacterium]|nr:aminotransferase class I/II-fold pyridoxal phosphate-dependent enzyme [Deltaproteobacteria bacterium]